MKFYGMSWKTIMLSALMGIGINLLAKNVSYNGATFDKERDAEKALAAANGKETEKPKG